MISKLSAKYQVCAIRTADTRDGQLTTPGVYTWVVRELSMICPSFVHRLSIVYTRPPRPSFSPLTHGYPLLHQHSSEHNLSQRPTTSHTLAAPSPVNRALLRLERTMNLFGGREGAREGGSEGAREGRSEGGRERGREGARERWNEGAREGGREGGSERGSEGGREGGMTVIHIILGMFNSNPMIPQYLNNNLT